MIKEEIVEGDLLYHAVHGVCRVKEIIKQKQAGKEVIYYSLVPKVASHRTIEPISLLPSMAQIAGEMVGDALNAFAARDAALAEAVVARDTVVDSFYNSIFRTLVTYMVENPKTISECAHLLFIAKNIERIGDHATNVAEMVYYAATGSYLPERERPTEQPDS